MHPISWQLNTLVSRMQCVIASFSFVGSSATVENSEETDRFILKQTNWAIRHILVEQSLPNDLTAKRTHREVVMSTCVLLTSAGLRHNDLPAAHTHLTFGLRAAQEWRDAGNFDLSPIGPVVTEALADLLPNFAACANPLSFLLEDDSRVRLPADAGNNLEAFGFTETNIQSAVDGFGTCGLWLITRKHAGGFNMGLVVDSYVPLHSIEVSIMFKVYRWEKLLKDFIHDSSVSQPALHHRLLFLWLWKQVFLIKVGAAAAADKDRFHRPFQIIPVLYFTTTEPIKTTFKALGLPPGHSFIIF